MGKKRPPTLGELSFKFRHENSVIAVIVLIMRINTRILINIGDVRQEVPSKGLNLNLNKRIKQNPRNKKTGACIKEPMVSKFLKIQTV